MQIEMHDEKTLYCYLFDDDLKKMNISLDSLTYGSNSFRKLTATVLKTADEKYQFRRQELPLQVEAIPLENDELFLQISRVDEADELDPRFAQFSPSIFSEIDYEDAEDEDEDIDELYDSADVPELDNDSYSPSPAPSHIEPSAPSAHKTVYTFTTYEALMNALSCADSPESLAGIKSSLYFDTAEKNYYLIIVGHQNTATMRPLLASLCEYSTISVLTQPMQAWLSEHCTCLIRSKAVYRLNKSSLHH